MENNTNTEQQQTQQVKTYTNEQLLKMTSEMANDFHKLKAEKEQLENELKQRTERMKESESIIERIKSDRIKHLQTIYQQELVPFFNNLIQNRKIAESNPQLNGSIDTYKSNIEELVQKGFMKPQEEAQLHVLTSIASASKITSSDLQRALQTEAEWANKYDSVLTQKKDADKQIEELKKQIEDLLKKNENAQKNINNVESHFSTPVVEATASTTTQNQGFMSLFSHQPVPNWRTLYPEPRIYEGDLRKT